MTFCFDIDGVVMTRVPGNDYRLATPVGAAVDLVNALFAAGHRIVLHTARGSLTGIDWRETTIAQLRAAGVRYHEVLFGKPAADFYIDDRAMPLDALAELFRMGVIGAGSDQPASSENQR